MLYLILYNACKITKKLRNQQSLHIGILTITRRAHPQNYLNMRIKVTVKELPNIEYCSILSFIIPLHSQKNIKKQPQNGVQMLSIAKLY